MTTLSLFVIFGMLGLAVDLGWSYFRVKAARTAADAAALAAAKTAFGGGSALQAVSLVSCASVSDANLLAGCEYAQKNDFDYTTNTRQVVKMQAGTGTYTTQTGGTLPTQYWAKAVAAESIPQLFSAILGHATGQASAFATAGIVKVIVNGSLILLNQAKANDCAIFATGNGNGNTTNKTYCGVDLNVQGSGGNSSTGNGNGTTYTLQTSGNILLSSTCNGSGGTGCSTGAYAGINQGGSIFTSGAGTQIKGSGWYTQNNNGTWQSTPTNGAVDGFGDPLANLNQPPVPSSTTQSTVIKVPTKSGYGVLDSTVCNPCGSGSYVAVDSKGVPNGYPIQISGNVAFNGGSFGQFVIYGGLTGSNNSTATFGPGEYVFAGAQVSNGTPGSLLATGTGFSLQDNTTTSKGAGFNGPASDAGELFVFTNATGLGLSPSVTGMPTSVQNSLVYGNVNLQSGSTSNNVIDLHGLNSSNLPTSGSGSSFSSYTPVLVWQDRGNVYNANNPSKAPELGISASPYVHLYGTIYQPEGAWTTLNGGGGYNGPLQIISGALNMQGSAKIDLTAPTTPLTTLKVALIE